LQSIDNDRCDSNCVTGVKKTFEYNSVCGGSCPAECDLVKFVLETTTRKVFEDQNILNTIKLDVNRTMKGWNVGSLEEVSRELVAFDIN